jgi:hypothetical protein
MPWVRLDENFAQHPKVLQAGPLGMAMHVSALCYCNRHLTDGFVPKQIASMLLDLSGLAMRMWDGDMVGGGQDATWELIIEDLVGAGLWEPVKGGWLIHDYLDYQPSKQQIQRVREIRSEVGRKGGEAKSKQIAKQNSGNGAGKSPGKIEAKVCPDPVPDTVSPKKESHARADALAEFERWYESYPRKKSRGAAERAYRAARKIATAEELLAGVERFKATLNGTEPRFIAHPASWLNGKRWLDDDVAGPDKTDPKYWEQHDDDSGTAGQTH